MVLELDLQAVTTAGNFTDLSFRPLFSGDPSVIFTMPTYLAAYNLYSGNYDLDVTVAEDVTAAEILEQTAFLDAIMSTSVMQQAHQFLANQGLVSSDVVVFQQFLSDLWFTQYARYVAGVEASSGFEHVFRGEIYNGTVQGMHSWSRMYIEEQDGDMNYLGYIRIADAGTNIILEMPLDFYGATKAADQVVLGASPELEIALATICFLARPNGDCPLQAADGAAYTLTTYPWNYQGVDYMGSAHAVFV